MVSRLQRETAALAQRARRFAWHPRVFVVLQAAPIWTAGTSSYISRLVAIAGGRNAAQLKTPYAQYSAETLVVNQPDVLIADRIAQTRCVARPAALAQPARGTLGPRL